MATFVRPPAVAGHFYTANPDRLRTEVLQFSAHGGEKISAFGCVVPHAGYMYSGHVAGAVYGALELPTRFVILCPNHTGEGQPLAIMTSGLWQTPLGDVEVDFDLAHRLIERFSALREDQQSQKYEHALEVQLPFLQVLASRFTFVPITVGISRYEYLRELGEALGQTLAKASDRVMIIASSDMNHYESDSVTREKDRKAIERILTLDAAGLHDTLAREHSTMCGYGPAIAMLIAAKMLGAKSAELVKYATSGDVSGDRESVVGYAGIIVK
jgi:AmmeMemoRadiSam system protein B